MILGNTLGGHDFSNFIKNALEMREAEILNKNDLQIEISERIASSFRNSKMVSGEFKCLVFH